MDIAVVIALAGAVVGLIALLVPPTRCRYSLPAQILISLCLVAAGGIWLAFALFGFVGGVDGIDTSLPGWLGDPGAWQRYALVVIAAAAVGLSGIAVRLLFMRRNPTVPTVLVGLLAVGWCVLASSG